jgi:membrane-associated phospholipid phosphatase
MDHALLRGGSLIDFDRHRWLGLITFPSYHALLAVAFAWGWWSVPFLRWPGVVLNAGMLISTPLHGSHHLVDTIAGTALAVASIAIAWRIMTGFDVRDAVPTRGFVWIPVK